MKTAVDLWIREFTDLRPAKGSADESFIAFCVSHNITTDVKI